jgi:hypothetical protein
MYLRFIVLFLIIIQLSPVFGQTIKKDSIVLQTPISIHRDQTSLFEILNEIQDNYNINFSYTDDLISLDYKVSIKSERVALYKILNLIFAQTSIQYVVIGKQIVLAKPKDKSLDPPLILLSTQSKDSLVEKTKRTSHRFVPDKKTLSKMKNIKNWRRSHSIELRANKVHLNTKISKGTSDTTNRLSDTLKEQSRKRDHGKLNLKTIHYFKYPMGNQKFSLDVNFMAGSSFRKLSAVDPEGDEIAVQRKQENRKFGFNSEIILTRYFGKFFSFGGGLGFLNSGANGNFNFENNSHWQSSGSYSEQISYSNNYTFITIPVTAGSAFHSGPFSLKLIFGLVPAILISSGKNDLNYYNYEYYFRYINASSWDKQDMKVPVEILYRKFNMAYTFRMEGNYRIRKLGLGLGINYLHFLFSTYKNSAPIKEKIFLPGVYAVCKYYF